MTDREALTMAAEELARSNPQALNRLFEYALALLLGEQEAAHQLEMEIRGLQVLAQALGDWRGDHAQV